jgi:hypothetical protein
MRKYCFCFVVLFAISYKHPKFAFAHNYNSNCRICGWIHYRPTSLGLNKGHFRSRFNWPTIGISHVKALLHELSISILINALRYTILSATLFQPQLPNATIAPTSESSCRYRLPHTSHPTHRGHFDFSINL